MSQAKPLPIVGMSPGNSYFKEDKIAFLLDSLLIGNDKIAIMIADLPAISTYLALGYSESRARTDKAVRNGNNIKNRVRKVIEDKKIDSERVTIVDWEREVDTSPVYKAKYVLVKSLYDCNSDFRLDCNRATESVLKFSRRNIENIDAAVSVAVHYLLSEIAFLEYAGEFFNVDAVKYVYHNNWPVYERYISGTYDNRDRRSYMKFGLLEHPAEKYVELVDDIEFDLSETALERVDRTKMIFAGYAEYEKAFYIEDEVKKGFCHVLLEKIASDNGWEVVWTQEVGYGAIIESLNSKKFDIFASTVWATPERLEQALFSKSFYESEVFSWCREGYVVSDKLRIAVKENDVSHSLAKKYPNSELVFIEQLANTMELLNLVVDKRADMTFVETGLANRFNHSSVGKIVKFKDEKEEIFSNTFMFRLNEPALSIYFNKDIERLMASGFVDSLLHRYNIM